MSTMAFLFYFNPAEWLWRSLTYLKLHPMKKASADAVPPENGVVA